MSKKCKLFILGIALLLNLIIVLPVEAIDSVELPEKVLIDSNIEKEEVTNQTVEQYTSTKESTDNEVISPSLDGVGKTIAQTFPDPDMAKDVAQMLNVDIQTVLTNQMIENLHGLTIGSDCHNILGIEVLVNLEYLTIASRSLTSLPESIGQLKHLERLTVVESPITNLPESIGQLINLNYLKINYTQLTSLPESIGQLLQLSELNINNNHLINLPESIGQLAKLGTLNVKDNQLTSLPESVGQLTQLDSLYATDNQLTSLPKSIGQLSDTSLGLVGNLLPSNFADIINELFGTNFYQQTQRKLTLKANLPSYRITSKDDLDNLDLFSMVIVGENTIISPSQHLILDGYVDENNELVDLNSYMFTEDGSTSRNGKIYAQIRATGAGLFPNTSDNAITEGRIELSFESNFDVGKVLLRYQDIYGESIEQNNILTGKIGSPYEAEEKTIEGYKLKEVRGNTIGVFTTEPKEVIYIYEKNQSNKQQITNNQENNPSSIQEIPSLGEEICFDKLYIGIGSFLIVTLFYLIRKKSNA